MDTMEMMDFGRSVSKCQITHAFIKTNVECNLDATGLRIAPQNVLGDIQEKTKKDAMFHVVLQAAACPHTGQRSRVAGFLEKSSNLGVVVKFRALIHVDVLVLSLW